MAINTHWGLIMRVWGLGDESIRQESGSVWVQYSIHCVLDYFSMRSIAHVISLTIPFHSCLSLLPVWHFCQDSRSQQAPPGSSNECQLSSLRYRGTHFEKSHNFQTQRV